MWGQRGSGQHMNSDVGYAILEADSRLFVSAADQWLVDRWPSLGLTGG